MNKIGNFASASIMPLTFASRRSPVWADRGMVAASQPAAVAAGLDMLRLGGSAADAAVATAAALAVTEPCSTGIGGDAFALYFDASTGTVHGLNGSGRSGAGLTLEVIQRLGFSQIPPHHGISVTVPGAWAAWCALHERFGRLELGVVLAPAIRLARGGFVVGPVTSELWSHTEALLAHPLPTSLLQQGRAPNPGERVTNEAMAQVLELVAKGGRRAFYEGEMAARMARAVQNAGGVLTEADFAKGTADWVTPLTTDYRQVRVHECPPNGQGIVALSALAILRHTELTAAPPLSARRLHWQIEALRLAFADAFRYVADPNYAELDWPALFSDEYAQRRAALIHPERRNANIKQGTPAASSDTVQFCAADRDGNAVSMVNSVYTNFGSGIVPEGLGFVLQNRGCNFTLLPGHPNCAGPGKRPYHTIIPCLTTNPDGSLHGVHGVMGGFMQPQGHVQVLSAILDDGLDPQAALNRPRFCVNPNDTLSIEEGMPEKTVARLISMVHPAFMVTGHGRKIFGRGQIILRRSNGFYEGGSDPRADGCVFGL